MEGNSYIYGREYRVRHQNLDNFSKRNFINKKICNDLAFRSEAKGGCRKVSSDARWK